MAEVRKHLILEFGSVENLEEQPQIRYKENAITEFELEKNDKTLLRKRWKGRAHHKRSNVSLTLTMNKMGYCSWAKNMNGTGLDGASGSSDFDKPWKRPPNRDYVHCVEPSPSYTDHFINSLANDVKFIKKLPKELESATGAVKPFRSWSGGNSYQEEIASMWEEYQRAKGYCPLTPKEVGMFLTALGFPSNTPIYIAAGEIYGGVSHMAALQSHYPILMNKTTVKKKSLALNVEASRETEDNLSANSDGDVDLTIHKFKKFLPNQRHGRFKSNTTNPSSQ
ncbi:hypothetical protein RJ640_028529 [Escallonia rubra]|uniref:O-fucosyltransferase family protein n=1 Tax=Escallonia rubra TaxID=112253 RepID=A0AA88R5H9_9ASTE|nr:hypothetical protein RJ640_028529 [Escallonia rubra]